MRSEQDRRTSMGARQSHSPEDGGDRPEGQYEKDPWHADAPHRGQDTGGDHGFGQGSLEPERRTERRRYPVGPKGYQRSDERLREDISERLMQAREIDSSDVTVAVSGAKLVLEGTVPERWMKHAIEDLADICPGLQDIENHIRVKR